MKTFRKRISAIVTLALLLGTLFAANTRDCSALIHLIENESDCVFVVSVIWWNPFSISAVMVGPGDATSLENTTATDILGVDVSGTDVSNPYMGPLLGTACFQAVKIDHKTAYTLIETD